MKIQYAVRDGLQKSINEFNAVGGLSYFDPNKKLGPNDKYLFNMIT